MGDTATPPPRESSFAPRFIDLALPGRPLRIEYAWTGQEDASPVIVFLHEGLGSRAMWKNFPQQLCAAAGARGFVFSRYGYGKSTPRPADEKWPVEFMHREARDVLPPLLAELGIARAKPWLFGHSDGASIALLYAAAHPGAVSGLILLAPHVFVEDVSIASIERANEAYRTADLQSRLRRYHDDPDSAFFGWNDVWLDPAFRAWNIERELESIACPVLAVQGEDDEYGTMAQIEAIAARVPRARLLKLAACGHSPHRDQPGALSEAVMSFIDEHRPVAARPPAASRS